MTKAEPKLCRDCAHLVGSRGRIELALSWACHAPENMAHSTLDLVSGKIRRYLRFERCQDARAFSSPTMLSSRENCGPEGHWFVLYEPPAPRVDLRTKAPQPDVDSLLKELE